MRRSATVVLATVLLTSALVPTTLSSASPLDPAASVDPLIGSKGDGNTYPGATAPFGMLAWSPTSTRGDQTSTGAANGYQYDTTRLRGFSLTHVNGAGCNPGAAGDVPIMPFTGNVTSSPTADTKDAMYASDFSHADEKATPGRYRLGLANGVTTDFAATERTAAGRVEFPAGSPANLLFRTSNSLNGSEDAETHIDPARRQVTGSVLTGAFCGRRANGGVNNRKTYYRLYFTAQFDQPFTSTGTWRDSTLQPGGRDQTGGEGYATGKDRAGRGSGGWVGFAPGSRVAMRISISYVSLAGAERNLRAEQPPWSTVDSVAAAARREWNTRLGRVRIGGGTPAQRTVFYTALYHSLQQPNLVSDVDGHYLGMDREPHRLERGQDAQYSNFSGWDQYRAQIQLLALLEPRVAGNFAQSLFNYAKQNDGVWDRWVHVNGATHVMTGDPAAATLATFYAMGVRNFDYRGAFDSLYAQATVPRPEGLQDAGCPGQCVGQRPNLAQYLQSHYAANDVCHCWGGGAETLEDSIADFALGQWAAQLGRKKEAAELSARGEYWRNVFNPATGYPQARNLDGSWATPFDPASDRGFAQGSAAAYAWLVPQDVTGLADAMGGKETAAKRLDGFFHDAAGNWQLRGGGPLKYDPTNEPDIHAPWLYNELGRPWQTQETVRQIVDTVYTTGPSGLPGNDDLGTMSAWYVFGALGIYPRTPGSGEMLLSSPLFPHAEVRSGSGAVLTITGLGSGKYVRSAWRDGKPQRDWKAPASLTRYGGRLDFVLSPSPTEWASQPL
ncbi:glycoside hydrolase family 92 protein [Amycolatopsis rubida]|uniref:Glycoside hydrolase family 92 protein n=1 Tax=Amycolatopsis rubida TaxID=112413 RepID=A0ABX0BMP5_9PSEU|nr:MULTISPECIES: GH92 family glycosyl hydrolase [Amycolatopsis]MYW91274.1 glycoside hydrolase family 92 protein [Amycolatopsis rubida]NEC56259.1 glycoside hydrolase family 92 protein [Amycolatopsis rubida]OAP28848.1 Glycosyl hydrolase family 92 [Amycolatopsis sp. M39]